MLIDVYFSDQSQDLSSGCELSELLKRRLESVASTGSSASSGFIEDKSYCDSEEEEEGTPLIYTPLSFTPHPGCSKDNLVVFVHFSLIGCFFWDT